MKLHRNGAVGFIVWLDRIGSLRPSHFQEGKADNGNERCAIYAYQVCDHAEPKRVQESGHDPTEKKSITSHVAAASPVQKNEEGTIENRNWGVKNHRRGCCRGPRVSAFPKIGHCENYVADRKAD
jgi:hypothetical protein